MNGCYDCQQVTSGVCAKHSTIQRVSAIIGSQPSVPPPASPAPTVEDSDRVVMARIEILDYLRKNGLLFPGMDERNNEPHGLLDAYASALIQAAEGRSHGPAPTVGQCLVCRDVYPSGGQHVGVVWAMTVSGRGICKRCVEAARDARRAAEARGRQEKERTK